MKTNKTVSLDNQIILELKLRNINASKIINDYLKAYLAIEEREYVPEELDKEILSAEAKYLELKALKQLEEQRIKAKEEERKKAEENAKLEIEEQLRKGVLVKI